MNCKNMAKSLEDTRYFLIFALFKDRCYENSSRLYTEVSQVNKYQLACL